MPLFEYKCAECSSRFEVLHKSVNLNARNVTQPKLINSYLHSMQRVLKAGVIILPLPITAIPVLAAAVPVTAA
jgi:predicted nucleic acid-binding Zn ribbon protein